MKVKPGKWLFAMLFVILGIRHRQVTAPLETDLYFANRFSATTSRFFLMAMCCGHTDSAFTSLNTLVSSFASMTAYQPLFLMSCHSLIFVQGQVVHSSEGAGDTDIHWTDFCAVVTGSTWDQRDAG